MTPPYRFTGTCEAGTLYYNIVRLTTRGGVEGSAGDNRPIVSQSLAVGRLRDFLDDEQCKVEETTELFARWHLRLPEALDDAAGLHRTFRHAYRPSYDDDQRVISECVRVLQAHGLDPDLVELEALAYAESIDDHPHGDTLRRAREALDRSWSIIARGMLLSMIGRSYMWAVADLHRRRITPVLGHQRVQAESAALMMIMLEQPSVAKEWIELYEGGQRFHLAHRDRVRELLNRFGLWTAYEVGSGVALHARSAGAAHSLVQRVRDEPSRKIHEVAILPDEYDPSQPQLFINHVLFLVRMQQRLFEMVRFALPEVTDPVLLDGRLPRFASLVKELDDSFAQSFPEDVARWRERSAAGPGDGALGAKATLNVTTP